MRRLAVGKLSQASWKRSGQSGTLRTSDVDFLYHVGPSASGQVWSISIRQCVHSCIILRLDVAVLHVCGDLIAPATVAGRFRLTLDGFNASSGRRS
jgi:hypothetical protein